MPYFPPVSSGSNAPEQCQDVLEKCSQFKEGSPYILVSEGSELFLTSVPTPNIAVGEVLAGNPACFIAPEGSRQRKVKVLLLTFSGGQIAGYELDYIVDRLLALIAQGIKIFFKKADAIKPVALKDAALSDADTLGARLNMDAEPASVVWLAEQLKIGRETIYELNEPNLGNYLAGNELDFNWLLDTADFRGTGIVRFNDSGITLKGFLELIHEKNSLIKGLHFAACHTLFSGFSIGVLFAANLKDGLQNVKHLSFGEVSDYYPYTNKYLYNKFPNQNRIVFCSQILSSVDPEKVCSLDLLEVTGADLTRIALFKNLKNISIKSSTIDYAKLYAILNATTQLECLDIEGCNFVGDWPANVALNLDLLMHLSFASSKISADIFEIFLNAAPNLKKLNCSRCYNSGETFDFACIKKLLDLEELDASGLTITPVAFNAMLSNHPKLIHLNFSDCFFGNSSDSDVDSEYFDDDDGIHFAPAPAPAPAPALFSDNSDGDDWHFDFLKLAHLTALNLSGSDITSNVLQQIMAATSALRSLDVSECDQLRGVFCEADSACLSTLEHLAAFNSSLSDDQILIFLGSQNLKYLNLSGCNLTHVGHEKVTLNSLTELILSNSTLSQELFFSILEKNIHLKKIILANGTIAENSGFDFSRLPVTHLTEFHAVQSNITGTFLGAVLAFSPSLVLLDISFCRNIEGGFRSESHPPSSLSRLKELNAKRSALGGE